MTININGEPSSPAAAQEFMSEMFKREQAERKADPVGFYRKECLFEIDRTIKSLNEARAVIADPKNHWLYTRDGESRITKRAIGFILSASSRNDLIKRVNALIEALRSEGSPS